MCKDFFLKVEAVDGGTPPLKTSTIISIEVMDVNDNAPSFSEEIYNVLVSEDAAIGEAITWVWFNNVWFYTTSLAFITHYWVISQFIL